VESFFEICVIRERKVVFESSQQKVLTRGDAESIMFLTKFVARITL